MNLEIFTPLTISYEGHLRRLNEYQETCLQYHRDPPKDSYRRVRPFSFAERKLLCCTSEEQDWIRKAVIKADNKSLETYCLSTMCSIAAYLRSVCDCTLEHTPKNVLYTFVTKVLVSLCFDPSLISVMLLALRRGPRKFARIPRRQM